MEEKIFIIEELIKKKRKTPEVLSLLKRKAAKKFGLPCPSNSELFKTYHKLIKEKRLKRDLVLENCLRTRKVRSLSGIVVVSVLTKPFPCPGRCLYCPSQKGIPKSYLGSEPAVMRALLNKFNPCLQVQSRLRALRATGHPTDKIELRVIGGTWSFYPKRYQTWFIKECFRGANEYKRISKLPPPLKLRRTSKSQKSKIKFKNQNLIDLQKKNEKAKCRIIGITIETRPDFVDVKEIKRLRKLGVTRVELGVQSLYDDVLALNKRGHRVGATIKATKLLKDAGFKVCYQMMPNLPGSNPSLDEKMFEELFLNPDFQPDLLKIYPCSLLKEAPLYRLWQQKKYQPYKEKELIELLKRIKKKIPIYCRIQRIVRDIPAQNIVEGPTKISNLRQIIAKEAQKENWQCKCIRCREAKENYNPKEKLYLFRKDYRASKGKEIFLSFEGRDQKKLYSLLRLRIPSQYFERKPHFLRVLEKAALIREIHTYGQLLPIDKKKAALLSPQHKGMGKKLIKEAEKIAKKEFGLKKMAIISGVGVRDYFRKLGYRLRETYMVKNL
jgi:elongator complex protein 3